MEGKEWKEGKTVFVPVEEKEWMALTGMIDQLTKVTQNMATMILDLNKRVEVLERNKIIMP